MRMQDKVIRSNAQIINKSQNYLFVIFSRTPFHFLKILYELCAPPRNKISQKNDNTIRNTT